MSEKIAWTVGVKITDGPRFQDTMLLDVDAYDLVSVTVPGADKTGKTNTVTAQVQPSDAASVRFLLIRSSRYGDKLQFSLDKGGAAATVLDGPTLLAGGAVGLLGGAPKDLKFVNDLGAGNDAEITILVGRKAAS